MVSMTIKLEDDLKARIQAAAKEEEVSLSVIVRWALKEYLDKKEKGE